MGKGKKRLKAKTDKNKKYKEEQSQTSRHSNLVSSLLSLSPFSLHIPFLFHHSKGKGGVPTMGCFPSKAAPIETFTMPQENFKLAHRGSGVGSEGSYDAGRPSVRYSVTTGMSEYAFTTPGRGVIGNENVERLLTGDPIVDGLLYTAFSLHMSPEELEDLSSHFELVTFNDKQPIFTLGEEASEIFFVVSGSVDLYVREEKLSTPKATGVSSIPAPSPGMRKRRLLSRSDIKTSGSTERFTSAYSSMRSQSIDLTRRASNAASFGAGSAINTQSNGTPHACSTSVSQYSPGVAASEGNGGEAGGWVNPSNTSSIPPPTLSSQPRKKTLSLFISKGSPNPLTPNLSPTLSPSQSSSPVCSPRSLSSGRRRRNSIGHTAQSVCDPLAQTTVTGKHTLRCHNSSASTVNSVTTDIGYDTEKERDEERERERDRDRDSFMPEKGSICNNASNRHHGGMISRNSMSSRVSQVSVISHRQSNSRTSLSSPSYHGGDTTRRRGSKNSSRNSLSSNLSVSIPVRESTSSSLPHSPPLQPQQPPVGVSHGDLLTRSLSKKHNSVKGTRRDSVQSKTTLPQHVFLKHDSGASEQSSESTDVTDSTCSASFIEEREISKVPIQTQTFTVRKRKNETWGTYLCTKYIGSCLGSGFNQGVLLGLDELSLEELVLQDGEEREVGKRACTAVANGVTQCIYITRSSLCDYLIRKYDMKSALLFSLGYGAEQCLNQISFLERLSPQKIHHLSMMFFFLSLQPGEVLFREGDNDSEYGNSLFFLYKGSAEALVRDTDGTDKVVSLIPEGNFFGELGMLINMPRTATIRAHEHSLLLELHPSDFFNFSKLAPEVFDSFKYNLVHYHVHLKYLIHSPKLLANFRKFLLTEYSAENLDFIVEAKAFRCLDYVTEAEVEERALSIYDKYLRKDAPNEVNVKEKLRASVQEAVEREEFLLSLFQPCEDAVMALMNRDSFARYRKSPIFLSFLNEVKNDMGSRHKELLILARGSGGM